MRPSLRAVWTCAAALLVAACGSSAADAPSRAASPEGPAGSELRPVDEHLAPAAPPRLVVAGAELPGLEAAVTSWTGQEADVSVPSAITRWPTVPISGGELRGALTAATAPERLVLQGFREVDPQGLPVEATGREVLCTAGTQPDTCSITAQGSQVAVRIPLTTLTDAHYFTLQATWLRPLPGSTPPVTEVWCTFVFGST